MSYQNFCDGEEKGYLAKLMEQFNYCDKQSSLFDDRELLVGHKYAPIWNLWSLLQGEIRLAELLHQSIKIDFFEIDESNNLDIFNTQICLICIRSDEFRDVGIIFTVHDYINNKASNFNNLVEDSFEKMESYKKMKNLKEILQVVENINEFEEPYKI